LTGLIRTAIERIRYTVAVPIRATAQIRRARVLRAGIKQIGYAVAITVERANTIGTAEVIATPGAGRASVLRIGDAVAVSVGRTAFIFERSSFTGASILSVRHAIEVYVRGCADWTTGIVGCSSFVDAGIDGIANTIFVEIREAISVTAVKVSRAFDEPAEILAVRDAVAICVRLLGVDDRAR
jgi:hypothetical protein